MTDVSAAPNAAPPPLLIRFPIVLLVIVVLAAACQDSSDSEQEVFDFAEIADSGPVIEPRLSGTSAILRVTTTIDAVCAVAFGETEDLGMLATDQEMGGAGHSDHDVNLGGLSPDTDYFYRLQGVGWMAVSTGASCSRSAPRPPQKTCLVTISRSTPM